MSIDDFARGFLDEPGYLDYAALGPPSRSVLAESTGHGELLARARFGSLRALEDEDARMRVAVAAATGFHPDRVAFQPDTSVALMHVLFGLTGTVLLSPHSSDGVRFAAARAAESLHVLIPRVMDTDHGRLTPGDVRNQLVPAAVAVVVSLVDPATGFVADLEGIRQVIGDRLLVVDAEQGFTVVDAAYEAADVVVAPGHTWARAGRGTGFLAMSDRALERITPVISGAAGAAAGDEGSDELVPPPVEGAQAFRVSTIDPLAASRFAAAVEDVAAVGVAAIGQDIAARVDRVLGLADEFRLPVTSPRDRAERAGIVTLGPSRDQVTRLTAQLANHGITATATPHSVRLSVHVSTGDETLAMLRAAFVAHAAAR